MILPPEQRELARHALGLPNPRGVSFRNHFVTGPGSRDYDAWQAMVAAGAARRRDGSAMSGGDPIFWLTEAGARAALDGRERLDPEAFTAKKEAARG